MFFVIVRGVEVVVHGVFPIVRGVLVIVHGVFVLVNAGRSKSFSPDKQTLKKLEARYGHGLIEIFGIAINALTANEARYLVGFRTADEIRNRLAKAKQEIDLRLRSKGIPSVFGS